MSNVMEVGWSLKDYVMEWCMFISTVGAVKIVGHFKSRAVLCCWQDSENYGKLFQGRSC